MARIAAVEPKKAGATAKLACWYFNRRFHAVPEPIAMTATPTTAIADEQLGGLCRVPWADAEAARKG
jgi:hypothetical protein